MLTKFKNNKGFTLLELAIVMLIGGLMMVSAARLAKVKIIEKQQEAMSIKRSIITSALSSYIADTREMKPDPANPTVLIPTDDPTTPEREDLDEIHYPCPANPRLGPGDANFGLESREVVPGRRPDQHFGITCSTTGGVIVIGTSPNRIFVGAVPTRNLGISDETAIDPYGNKLVYAVSESFATSQALEPSISGVDPATLPRPIKKQEKNAPAPDPATYGVAFYSVGPDGRGAYGMGASNSPNPCTGTTRFDSKNCKFTQAASVRDEIFVSAGINYSESNNSNHIDDTIQFGLVSIDSSGGAGIGGVSGDDTNLFWDRAINSQTNIYNTNPNFVGIGTAHPQAKLHVNGTAMLGQDVSTAGLEVLGGIRTETVASDVADIYMNGAGVIEAGSSLQIKLNADDTSPQSTFVLSREHMFNSGNGSQTLISVDGPGNLNVRTGNIQLGKDGGESGGDMNITFGDLNISNGDANVDRGDVIVSSGAIGVGTSSPIASVDVDGSIRIGNTSDDPVNDLCNRTNSGEIRYNDAVNPVRLEYCNGTEWTAFGQSLICKNALRQGGSGSDTYVGDPTLAEMNNTTIGSLNVKGIRCIGEENWKVTGCGIFDADGSGDAHYDTIYINNGCYTSDLRQGDLMTIRCCNSDGLMAYNFEDPHPTVEPEVEECVIVEAYWSNDHTDRAGLPPQLVGKRTYEIPAGADVWASVGDGGGDNARSCAEQSDMEQPVMYTSWANDYQRWGIYVNTRPNDDACVSSSNHATFALGSNIGDEINTIYGNQAGENLKNNNMMHIVARRVDCNALYADGPMPEPNQRTTDCWGPSGQRMSIGDTATSPVVTDRDGDEVSGGRIFECRSSGLVDITPPPPPAEPCSGRSC